MLSIRGINIMVHFMLLHGLNWYRGMEEIKLY
jgi:hypothetical protein